MAISRSVVRVSSKGVREEEGAEPTGGPTLRVALQKRLQARQYLELFLDLCDSFLDHLSDMVIQIRHEIHCRVLLW
jgi:hypothetical protein